MLCYILQICSLFAACLPWCISTFHIFKPVTMFLWSINDSVDCLHYSKYKVESKHSFLDTTLCFFFKLSNLRPWSHEFFMKLVGGYKSLTIFAKKETSYICTLKTCIYISFCKWNSYQLCDRMKNRLMFYMFNRLMFYISWTMNGVKSTG